MYNTARNVLFSAIKFDDDRLTEEEQIFLREIFKEALIKKACPSMFDFLKQRGGGNGAECNGNCRACWLHDELTK